MQVEMKNIDEDIVASDAVQRGQAIAVLAVGDGDEGWNKNAHIAQNDAVFFMKMSCGTMSDKMEWKGHSNVCLFESY